MTITIRLTAAFAWCALLAGSAGAGSLQAKLEAFEFFGDWSPQCDDPPSSINIRRHVFVSGSGRVMFTETLGPDYRENVYVVLGARRRETNQRLALVKQNGRLRTMTNRRSDGTYLVRNGTALSSAQPTPWLSRCAEPH